MFAFIIFCISSSRFSLKSSIFIYCSLFRSHTSTKFGILVISMQWRQYSHKLLVKINFPSVFGREIRLRLRLKSV